MPKIRHLGSLHPSYPSHCRSTASTQDLYPRSLGILGFSGCVRGFLCPKSGTWVVRARHMHYVPAPPENRSTSTHKCAVCYFYRLGLARQAKA